MSTLTVAYKLDATSPTFKLERRQLLNGQLLSKMAMVVMLNSQLISLETKIGGKPAVCLLDSGPSHNFFPLNQCRTNGLNFNIEEQFGVRVVDGQEVLTIGKVKCLVDLGPLKSALTLYILDCDAPYILGIPFFQTVNPIIDWTACSISVYTAEGLLLL